MVKHLLEHLPGQLHGEIVDSQVTVSGGPTLLGGVKGRKDFIMHNLGPSIVYIGGATVTAGTGYPVPVSGDFGFQAGRTKIYAVVSGTHSLVRILEIG